MTSIGIIEQNKIGRIRKRLMLPMKIVQFYLCATIVLFLFGPFKWPMHNSILFFTFLIAAQSALYIGYKISINKYTKQNGDIPEADYKFMQLLYIMIAINFIFTILNTIHNTGMSGFSIQDLYSKVQNGLFNPYEQYKDKFSSAQFGGALLTKTSTLFAPLCWSSIPLSLIYFKRLNLSFKAISIFSILLESFRWVATGTNKGIFDILIIIGIIVLIKKMQRADLSAIQILSSSKKKSKRKILIILILLTLGITYFTNSIGSRVNENWYNLSVSTGNVPIEFDSFLSKICPVILQPTLVYLTSYLTQGYYALSMALTLPWTPMFGIGNSMFLMENFKELSGNDVYPNTYQVKLMDYGWNPMANWHSIYVWLANDFHFIGVIPIMFILGFFFAEVVKDVVILKKPSAVVLMCLFFIIFFYFPANNQVLSYPSTFMTFWTVTLLWFMKRSFKLKIS
ncbi:hypothetical protein [Bacillus sp. FJAT-26390]|uniref:hypothetical protein n=1 Tax=Bacillus sp. FJAT-26390 TaxID=1743142 RepID=UPI000807B8D2|nr:hypothetical protein [Bacillus sp. FJAT-26390]OBZ11225.1 hypothetical protein A7975_19925 [Bacillus sp. FJAT-26390]